MAYSEALEQQIALLRLTEQHPEMAGSTPDEINKYTGTLKGSPYYWSPDLCQFLKMTASTLPPMNLPLRLLPGPAGFMWFAQPIDAGYEVTSAKGTPLDGGPYLLKIHAISWGVFRQRARLEDPFTVVCLWGSYPATPNEIFPAFHWSWDQNETQEQCINQMLTDGTIHPDEGSAYIFRASLFGAAILFLQQRILVARQHVAERHARKRLEREGWQFEPLIRVVELRRKERLGEKQPVEPVEREWSCQWVVRGHWRQQFYPSKHQNQPIWITPYVKGPEDKPLKPPRATVFAVVR